MTEETPPAETKTPIDYSCRFCGHHNNSRQARHGHEKTCPENPKNKEKPDIDANRQEYEKVTGLEIPVPEEPDDPGWYKPADDDFTFDPLIALAGIGILLIVGAILLRDRIIALFRGKPPQQGRGYLA
jgi:hypothetical protein